MGAAGTLNMSRAATPARRSTWVGIGLAIAVLGAAVIGGPAMAREAGTSGALKGQWAFDVETPNGRQPLSIALRGRDQGGMLITPAGLVEVEYRQDGAAFSIAAELPGAVAPTGSGQTLILRGTQTSDTTATGTAIFIGDAPRAGNAHPYEQTTGSFSATRQ